METLACRSALFSSCNCLQRILNVSNSIFKTLFSCFKRAMRFFSLWATDDELSSALISLSLNPVPSIEELNEPAILETHQNHGKKLRGVWTHVMYRRLIFMCSIMGRCRIKSATPSGNHFSATQFGQSNSHFSSTNWSGQPEFWQS